MMCPICSQPTYDEDGRFATFTLSELRQTCFQPWNLSRLGMQWLLEGIAFGGEGAVYFVHLPTLQQIKVGISGDPRRRLSQLRKRDSRAELLAQLPDAGPEFELFVHSAFECVRESAEQFTTTHAMLSLVGAVKAASGSVSRIHPCG